MEQTFQIVCSTQSKPLKTLEELLEWNPLSDCKDSKPYTVSSLRMHKTSNRRVKTLLCHDMKGGYLDDRFNDGCDNQLAYRFFHWSSIDIFVYFSHNFVSIPPLGWINASHRNGVPILGTIIVEGWAETGLIGNQIFSNTDLLKKIVSQLVQIAKLCHFDGWLINIECEVDPQNIQNLVSFVKLLTEMMHNLDNRSLVIWYDSVTSPDGKLNWQNELNLSNKCFFDVCDGIFLNYTWNESNLKASHQISLELSRNYDVFVGVDVFGRNCFGGGGMNTKLALNEIRKYELSIAIFASGWTHEVLGCDNFTANECSFWSSLELGVHHYPNTLPICSSFCQGFGNKLFRNGKVINDNPWHNLSLQQLQPSNHQFLEIYLEDAYNGGASLKMKNNSITLFQCEIIIKKIIYAITYKSKNNQKLTTILNCVMNNQLGNSLLSISLKSSNCVELNDGDIKIKYIKNEEQIISDDREILNECGIFGTNNGWVTDCFSIENTKHSLSELIIKSIDLCDSDVSEDQISPDILIGLIMIIDSK